MIDINQLWLQQLNRAMDTLMFQHQVQARNIANANTPGYISQALDFHTLMREMFQAGEQGFPPACPGLNPNLAGGVWRNSLLVENSQAPARADGNNVNLEQQMVQLAENSQLYNTVARFAAQSVKSARYVISGGRG